ncbi:hypothetical protein TcasGA2_TC006790 [Tribolium castaneum]|uniref:Uncharacterized protein n=1 Tax=Tribolium castaneum TaxID=7070 RepID=D6WUW6_TRICA|nr:hypothetical protein TcasGA2_TC006790 [Tribolium castaneum]
MAHYDDGGRHRRRTALGGEMGLGVPTTPPVTTPSPTPHTLFVVYRHSPRIVGAVRYADTILVDDGGVGRSSRDRFRRNSARAPPNTWRPGGQWRRKKDALYSSTKLHFEETIAHLLILHNKVPDLTEYEFF